MKKDTPVLKALKTLAPIDALTIHSCLLYCATLNKADRKDFQKIYGLKVDENITQLVQDLQ